MSLTEASHDISIKKENKIIENSKLEKTTNYVTMNKIAINNSSELILFASNEGLIGNGTLDDPYILDNIKITSSDSYLL